LVAKKVEALGGMLPAIDQNLLPDNQAALAQNTWMYSGAIAGMNSPTTVAALNNSATNKIFRIPNNFVDSLHLSDALFIEFQDLNTDTLRSQVVGETFDRYYFASPSQQPQYNTKARIAAGNTGANAPFLLGIPTPGIAPGVSPAGGSSATNRTTAYVYTWVSAYGEEGPPSPPTTVTGKIDATWNIAVTAAAAGDLGTNRNLARVRIYRTVTSSAGVATFFLVVDQPIGTLTFADTLTDTVVSQNISLSSTTWSAPPVDLQGLVAMPNGIFVGWRNNEVWFCEPFRAHAWPPQYALAVDFPIVGLGVTGQTLVVCTQSFSFAISGIHPSVMSQSKLASLEPCMSRGSIVSSPEGVYYASPNGLVLAAQGTIKNTTASFITKDKWNQVLSTTTLATLRAGKLATGAYYCWGSVRPGVFQPGMFQDGTTVGGTPNIIQKADFTGAINGALIDVQNQRVAFTSLTNINPLTNMQNDAWTSEVFVIRNINGVNTLSTINIADQAPTYEAYKWRSRVWQLMKLENMEVLRVYFDIPVNAPLLNPVPNASLVQTLAADQWGLARMYADGNLIWTRELRTSGALMRLPSGLKYNYVQFEFESRLYIKSIQFATSAKELATV
jgi:hypothetical protein